LREVFGERNVHLVAISPRFEKIGISTFIVLAGGDEIRIKDFEAYLKKGDGEITSAVVPDNVLDNFMTKNYSVVLKDDYAPVDNLIAPVFEERFGYNRKNR
jgi:hypothetical protein